MATTLTCAHPDCSTQFQRRTCQRYCSPACRIADRRCSRCSAPLPVDRKLMYCAPCAAELATERRLLPHVRAATSASIRLRTFGIDAEEYARMEAAQGGVCAICREPETVTSRNGFVKALAVDHDHDSGAVRGLLCSRCNTAVGLMQDDTARLRAAVAYLEAHR